MSDTTPILALPLIQPAQAQKHVTHNEAIARLDVLVQAAVASRALATPPAAPAPGDRWIIGPDPVGDWAGRAGQIAWWGDTGWTFVTPAPGWTVQILDEAVAVVFRDGAWQGPEGQRLQVAGLGVNTPADATNGLAVAAPASLLTHQGAGHQLKVNKATPADTASLLFQTGFSGRAEIGTAGSDDLTIKVSADGATWLDAVVIDDATGRVTMPGGFGSGSLLGGHAMVICGERSGTLVSGSFMALGNGGSYTAGAVMPASGKVVALGVSVSATPAGNNILSVAVNKVANTAYQVALNYAGSGVQTAWSDFSSAPLAFAAGAALNVYANTGTSGGVVTSLYVVFD